MLSRGLFREFLVNMRAGIGPQDLAQHNSGVGRGRKLKGKLHRQVWRLALRGYGNAPKEPLRLLHRAAHSHRHT